MTAPTQLTRKQLDAIVAVHQGLYAFILNEIYNGDSSTTVEQLHPKAARLLEETNELIGRSNEPAEPTTLEAPIHETGF